MMKVPPVFFPTAMICLCVFAAIVYAADGDIRRTIYYFAAAVLTASVTY